MAFRLVNGIRTYRSEGNQFKGYFRSPYGEAGSFADMENLSGKSYPLIKTREKRTALRTFTGCGGLFGHDRLGWIDGTAVYYDGEQVGNVRAGRKTVVEMGARAVIFPDKVMYNMEDGTFSWLENSVAPVGDVVYSASNLLGETEDYRTAVYVKVSAAGVGIGFRDNDVVKVTGSEALDGMYQIYTVTDDSFVVLATLPSQTVTQTDEKAVFARNVPDMDYVTECDNRLWGCSSEKHEIYSCALGDPTNWNTFQGLANDSYAATVGTPGAFTGAATHLGYVLFFKEDVIHKVFGTKPSNYQITTVHARGVEAGSAGSLCVMYETLHYLSPTGMVSYEGSMPSDIGAAMGEKKYHEAVAGTQNGQMWVSMNEAGSGDAHLFVYNGNTGYWYREDNTRAVAFRSIGGTMYMATERALYAIEGAANRGYAEGEPAEEPSVIWYAETGDLNMADLNRRHLQKVELRLGLGPNAVCRVMAKYDGKAWKTLKDLTGDSGAGPDERKAVAVPIVPHRCDRLRLRLEGSGPMELMELHYSLWTGSELG